MSVPELASSLVAHLVQRGLTLATCESLTGGLIAAAVTEVPGASAVFRGGLITYATDLKVSLAGVDAEWVAANGVINERTAIGMAVGTRERLGADLAVSCTGVAGPDPQDGVAPGLVWLALATLQPGREDAVITRCLTLAGDRAHIRRGATEAALGLVVTGWSHP